MSSQPPPDSTAVDGSKGSAARALLCRIVETPGLIAACTSYQDGTEMALYEDGDVAAAAGHLNLLILRRALGASSIAGGTGGGRGSSSTNSSNARNASRRTGGVGTKEGYEERNRLVLADEKHTEAEEEDGVCLLEDLKFSHRAADWAAAQGHLEVVRSDTLLESTVSPSIRLKRNKIDSRRLG